MVTGDAAYIKKINRALILEKIIEEGMISRADLSKVTALTRATISAQVADLLQENLVVEAQLEHNTVGRKPIMLSLNRSAGYALGIDLDYGQITFTLSDLLGRPVSSNVVELFTTNYEEIHRLLTEHIRVYEQNCTDSHYGLVGIVVAVHGLVTKEEIIHYIPRLNWHEVDLKRDLAKEFTIPIHIENNANLCAFAERVYVHHQTDNLLCATLYSGIGVGMMMNSEFFRGHDGFAGEIGHMIVMPEGKPCECGNKGCWEKYASETSVFKALSMSRHIKGLTHAQIQQWLQDGDGEVEQLMEQFLYYLAIGLNNIINMYNPDVLVLDSKLLQLYPSALQRIQGHLHSSISHYRELRISSLGKESCVLGACALAIKSFLDVPRLNLSWESA
ncbi:ROK family protein [Ectobacillus ponti]|uniref:ROK family protein n=1 Tax=Ectobacillus ponti TaxID=2961894 RepID=A0AA42BR21_9BACI|nr:ROK family protein [Ectobacillus ponti]MCP8970497.1 ROK family protein [Ectobacillus ponti]